MSQGKIVLMACGSFSPPTYMHLRMFEIARDYINSLGIGIVIGGIMSPVHDAYGKKDLVSAHHRVSMLRAALKSSSWVKVSDWETQQEGWTRTRVSLGHHQETINKCMSGGHRMTECAPGWVPDDVINVNTIDEPDNLMEKLNGNCETERQVSVKLLCGADLLESFSTPGLWSDEDLEAIVGRHGLVVVSRSGSDPGRFIYESDMLNKYRKNIILVTNYVANEVSSTVLRRLLRRGESAKYLTDDAVISYIRENQLYGATRDIIEYDLEYLDQYKKSPDDVIMTSPEETNMKNILISIRDKPTIRDETITFKRPRLSDYLLPNSNLSTVAPKYDSKPKVAFKETTYVPGKAVKVTAKAEDKKQKKVSSNDSCQNENDRRKSAGDVLKDSLRKSSSDTKDLCDKVGKMSLDGKDYKTRSCNDIVRLVLTKHGIHVISDTEAIV